MIWVLGNFWAFLPHLITYPKSFLKLQKCGPGQPNIFGISMEKYHYFGVLPLLKVVDYVLEPCWHIFIVHLMVNFIEINFFILLPFQIQLVDLAFDQWFILIL